MKRNLIVLAAVFAALSVLTGSLPAQNKPGFLGDWTGYSIIGDGSRINVNVSFAEEAAGYTGKLEVLGMTPELPLKNILFKDGKLTFEFDLMDDSGGGLQVIKIVLALDTETLKGYWFDAEGNSNIIELTLKK